MDLADVLAELGADGAFDALAPHWAESEACFPDAAPAFLTPAQIRASRELAALPAELDALLLETARRVRERPALLHLAWHCFRLLFEHRDYAGGHIAKWPSLERVLSDLSGVFYLLVALAVAPLTRAVHRELGVPEAITRGTLKDFGELTDLYRRENGGAWGVLLRILYWLRHYTAGELYGLGRMEYMVRPFRGGVQAFRHRESGETLALAEDGVWFDDEGHASVGAEAGGWTSRLSIDEHAIVGFPVSPFGKALRREVRLDPAVWRRVLGPRDPVLEMHIPAGGGMTPERCADSMRQALEFFPRYFPDRSFVGFACASWILNPDMAELCSSPSNMVLWQRELYLLPCPSNGRAGLFSIFGQEEIDPATAPRDTSLRRGVLDRLAAARPLRAGGMFMLKEDFQHFGTQFYCRRWPPSVVALPCEPHQGR